MNVIEGVTLVQITIGRLAYADDIAFFGEDIDMINRLRRKLINVVEKVALTVHDDKTEYLMVSQTNSN